MSTLITKPLTKPLRRALLTLGNDPRQSLRRFLLGFIIFMVGVALIGAGYYTWYLLQVPGLALLAYGGVIAGWGYIGLLASRFVGFIER